jgi:tetratricopeptide (TPR) repeat protein
LLNEAAYRLRALGRLTEALEPFRESGRMDSRAERWPGAAMSGNNLSELELSLGEVAAAVKDAERSVTYADRSSDPFLRTVTHTTHANAIYQAGRRTEAEARFREAEQMQVEHQSQYPLLYSFRGFQYCDLLLAEAEREAGRARCEAKQETLLARCRIVAGRAAQTLKWAEHNNVALLNIALDHLTLGRAALYAVILESRNRLGRSEPPSPSSQRGFTSAATEIDHAVSGLRRSGYQCHLPFGLLTRAWLRSLTGPRTGPESAESDLDEAWEIAERGPMPLHLADIHIYRARLFFRETEYPWNAHPDGTPRGPEDDLAAAEKLINKCGYHRRDEELADAREALKRFRGGHAP